LVFQTTEREVKMLLQMHEALLNDLSSGEKPFDAALSTFVPFLKIYTAYINNYDLATRVLYETLQVKKFASFLVECQNNVGTKLDLSSYLIMPVQRLPRYELLLRDLVKNTSDVEVNKRLTALLEQVKFVNNHLNESKRQRDNTVKMSAIQKSISGLKKQKINLFDKHHRVFLREGLLSVSDDASGPDVVGSTDSPNTSASSGILSTSLTGSGNDAKAAEGGDASPAPAEGTTPKERKKKLTKAGQQRYLFLFDDILLVTTPLKEGKYKFKSLYQLNDAAIIRGSGDDEQTKTAVLRAKDAKLSLKADSADDMAAWVEDINKGIEQSKKEDENMAARAKQTGESHESMEEIVCLVLGAVSTK